MANFNPRAWYWAVASNPGNVFSSASNNYVPETDATYVAWRAAGFAPSPIADETQLAASLRASAPELVPPFPAGLIVYANAKQWALATGGFTVTIAGSPRTFLTDTESQGLMTGKAVRFMQAGAPASTQWQFATGFVTIAAADFLAAATAIADFVQATFDTLNAVMAAINSSQITTREQVDTPPPGIAPWPANTKI